MCFAAMLCIAHMADYIFRELICGFLRDRTRILVTHQFSLTLPMATLVVCLDGKGKVAACCPPSQLREDLKVLY